MCLAGVFSDPIINLLFIKDLADQLLSRFYIRLDKGEQLLLLLKLFLQLPLLIVEVVNLLHRLLL